MNWIDFSKEKPKEEPHRPLLVRLPDNTYERVNSINYDRLGRITHWAEIEPPPKPDPFEEAWMKEFPSCVTYSKSVARHWWDAAIRWKEGQK